MFFVYSLAFQVRITSNCKTKFWGVLELKIFKLQILVKLLQEEMGHSVLKQALVSHQFMFGVLLVNEDQIMVIKWRKWKRVYDITCFSVPMKRWVLQLEGVLQLGEYDI